MLPLSRRLLTNPTPDRDPNPNPARRAPVLDPDDSARLRASRRPRRRPAGGPAAQGGAQRRARRPRAVRTLHRRDTVAAAAGPRVRRASQGRRPPRHAAAVAAARHGRARLRVRRAGRAVRERTRRERGVGGGAARNAARWASKRRAPSWHEQCAHAARSPSRSSWRRAALPTPQGHGAARLPLREVAERVAPWRPGFAAFNA